MIDHISLAVHDLQAAERLRERLDTILRARGEFAGRNFVLEDDNADALRHCRLERAAEQKATFDGFEAIIAGVLCDPDEGEEYWRHWRQKSPGIFPIFPPRCGKMPNPRNRYTRPNLRWP